MGAVVASTAVRLLVQCHAIRTQGIEMTLDTMRTMLLEAENTRTSISELNQRKAFDQKLLLEEYIKSGDLKGSTLYDTIPVVGAWKAIEEASQKQGFTLRI